MTFFATGDEFDSPGQELAFKDICWAEADVCSPQRFASQRGDTVIPEYRPDSYDLTGIRVYASSDRQPLKKWNWSLLWRGSFTIHDNMIAEGFTCAQKS